MKKYSIKELVKKIQEKEISCVEVVDYYIKEIEKKEDKIDAFLLLQTEDALKKAKELDEKIAKGEKVGRLAGIPIAIKDNVYSTTERDATGKQMKIIQQSDSAVFSDLYPGGISGHEYIKAGDVANPGNIIRGKYGFKFIVAS